MNIVSNNIVSISASSENPNFPAVMMLNNQPGVKYRAATGVNFVTIEAQLVGGADNIMMAGTNAVSVEVSAADPDMIILDGFDDALDGGELIPASGVVESVLVSGSSWLMTDGSVVMLSEAAIPTSYQYESYVQGNRLLNISGEITQRSRTDGLWITLSEAVDIPAMLTFRVLAPRGQTAEVGVITANIAETYGGSKPRYGMRVGRKEYGVLVENPNGTEYYKKGLTPRIFDGIEMLLTHENGLGGLCAESCQRSAPGSRVGPALTHVNSAVCISVKLDNGER